MIKRGSLHPYELVSHSFLLSLSLSQSRGESEPDEKETGWIVMGGSVHVDEDRRAIGLVFGIIVLKS